MRFRDTRWRRRRRNAWRSDSWSLPVRNGSQKKISEGEGRTLYEASVSLFSFVGAALDDDLAARQNVGRRADHLLSFERRVVDAHVQRLLRERVALLGIPHD